MIRLVSVMLLIFAMSANAIAHGLIMASPAHAIDGSHAGSSIELTADTSIAVTDEALHEKTHDGCCPKSGAHLDDKRSSCIADCSYVFIEVGSLDIHRPTQQFEILLTTLNSQGSANLFRPPRHFS